VYGQRDLSGNFTLDDLGRVSLLRAGRLDLRNLTFLEAEAKIVDALRSEIRAPEVAINIVEYRPVYVTGAVQRPGKFPYATGLTALRAISLAGGYTLRASRTGVYMQREGHAPVPATEDTVLAPGDLVDVHESLF
jgi:polysaccharide export outer membrane protein